MLFKVTLSFMLLLGNLSLYAGITASSNAKPKVIVQFSFGKQAYIVAAPKTDLEKRITRRLSTYLEKVLKTAPRVVTSIKAVPAKIPAIVLSSHPKSIAGITVPQASPEAFAIQVRMMDAHPVAVAAGNTELGLKRAVQRLIIKSEQGITGLTIPEMNISESPWIAQREWTICPWAPDLVRRSFSNPNVDKRLNLWLYSDQQIADYVEMFDWFGFSGTQLMETSANYAAMGSREAFQDKQLRFAKAIRENGQQVSYWVWAAQFDEYGWYDPEVTYTPEKGNTAFNDPKVRHAFEKYYNGYAKMAPYVDLLIAHYYDPGELKNREDVFSYLKLLQDKFQAQNPEVKLAVDFWAAGTPSEYMEQLISHGFDDALLLEMSLPVIYKPGQRVKLHEAAKAKNLKMGMWGWYDTEYETDQLPTMFVNAKLLKKFYQEVRDSAHAVHPITYWSEMEAYHLNNIFTMYASSQLLWNPDRDTDEILSEIAEGIWGPRNGPQVTEALKLIEDVRSGPTWNTFWWTTKEYQLGKGDPHEEVKRAAAAIANFEKMKTDTSYVPKFPLPFPPETFIELILPHLKQIRQFAEFRIKIEAIRAEAAKGTSKEILSKMTNEAWQPILEYNTWIGVFGHPEAIMQEKIIDALAKEYQFEVKIPGWMRYRNANRYLQRIQNLQRSHKTPYTFKANDKKVRAGEFILWSDAKANEYMRLLIREGAVVPVGDNLYQLPNWEEFSLK